MFALKFDDAKRKLATSGIELHDLATAMTGTDDYELWMGMYLMPENNTIHLIVEDDKSTHTFFTIHLPKPEPEELLTVSKADTDTNSESEGA